MVGRVAGEDVFQVRLNELFATVDAARGLARERERKRGGRNDGEEVRAPERRRPVREQPPRIEARARAADLRGRVELLG